MNEVLKLLESIVGPPIIGEDGKKDFTKLTRTSKEELAFKETIIELFKDKKIVREMSKYPRLITNKKMRTKLADEFILTHGPQTIYE